MGHKEPLLALLVCMCGRSLRSAFEPSLEGKKEVKVYPLVKAFTLTLVCQFYLGLDEPKCQKV